MMAQNISADNFSAASLEAFYNELRLCREAKKRAVGANRHNFSGFLKNYVEVEVVISLHFEISDPALQFCLLFFFVPDDVSSAVPFQIHAADIWKANDWGLLCNTNSKAVLVVRVSGEPPDEIISSSVGIRSRVWLMPANCVPEPLVNAADFEEAFEVAWVRSPRIVDLADDSSSDSISSMNGLIEGVTKAGDSLGYLALKYVAGKRAIDFDLLNRISSLRIKLDENGDIVWDKECRADGIELTKCVICPVDTLLSRKKRSGYRVELSF